ncbi:MAG: AAA domain-containing protein [Bacteroidota bacterium]|nr:AAA domain-containing protein [Bacteroidota bacterium]
MNTTLSTVIQNLVTIASQPADAKETFINLEQWIDDQISVLTDHFSPIIFSISKLDIAYSYGTISQDIYNKIKILRNENVPIKRRNEIGIHILVKLLQLDAIEFLPDELRVYKDIMVEPWEKLPEPEQFRNDKILILSVDPNQSTGQFIFKDHPNAICTFNIINLDEKRRRLFTSALKYFKLPLSLYIHQIQQQNDQFYFNDFIIHPDYLVDVTAIAECFNYAGTNPYKHLLHLFQYELTGIPILKGSIINDFLDALILNPELKFEDLFKNIFKKNPLAFCLIDDTAILELKISLQEHFANLKLLISNHFDGLIPNFEKCLLEPSFYSVEYGIQGRLDVFYQDESQSESKTIIELKSGKPFKSNSFGINMNHHAQTSLYSLLLGSVYADNSHPKSYILYSSQKQNPLRFAPTIPALSSDIFFVRNSILLLHGMLAYDQNGSTHILDLIEEKHFEKSESFTQASADKWIVLYKRQSELVKSYIKIFAAYIAKEQFISKTGRQGLSQSPGLASLWLFNEYEKLQQFSIIPNLKITEISQNKSDFPLITLEDQEQQSLITNFRIGDTLVLYPGKVNQQAVLHSQIFKCTLISKDAYTYQIRLRCRQFDPANKKHTWNIEHDVLDKPFLNQFQNIFEFAKLNPDKQLKWLGKIPATSAMTIPDGTINESSDYMKTIIHKIVCSQDYFLLWGPPGSGKTSIIIKQLVNFIFNSTDESILLLAYTNRAVDEICESIESIDPSYSDQHIRIGSRYAVDSKFQKNLLDQKIESIHSRKELKKLISEKRIFTATIASILGKKELFHLKSFDTVIIDEASQILEPQLIGLITYFRRCILIGDHMQLPAVSAQSDSECQIKDEALLNLGFTKTNQSLFERLFKQCIKNQWTHSYAMLKFQGRMHKDLMSFPAHQYYNDELLVIDDGPHSKQTRLYSDQFNIQIPKTYKFLVHSRKLFIPTQPNGKISYSKVNEDEAQKVVTLIKYYWDLYCLNKLTWKDDTLGIITPFRAQISKIKQLIHEAQLDYIPLTVDTAERYQGGARDIIIISCCVQTERNLLQTTSVNENGKDRKLNVALTRAREQVIIIGNKTVLNKSENYQALLTEYSEITL